MQDESVSAKVKRRIIEAIKEGYQHEKTPSELHLDFDAEMDLHLATSADFGPELVGAIVQHGVRKALEERGLFGFQVRFRQSGVKAV